MEFQRNIILAPFTTFNIGGPADFFIKAKTSQGLIEAIEWATKKNVPFFVLGTGANILIGDKGFRGLVIKNEAQKFTVQSLQFTAKSAMNDQLANQLPENTVLLTAESGAIIADLIEFTAKQGLSGLEHFVGIPSSVGGALWQNLHFLSPDRSKTVFIGDILEGAEILICHPELDSGSPEGIPDQTQNDKVKTVSKDYFKFAYDYSLLHDNQDVVLSATFVLQKETPQVMQDRIAANLKWREEKHPSFAWRVSAGSVFKKIEGYGAGRLIEKVGLKGYSIGGAQISPKHANFIVNTGNAKATDVRSLIDTVQNKVQNELGLTLKTEISFIGEF